MTWEGAQYRLMNWVTLHNKVEVGKDDATCPGQGCLARGSCNPRGISGETPMEVAPNLQARGV